MKLHCALVVLFLVMQLTSGGQGETSSSKAELKDMIGRAHRPGGMMEDVAKDARLASEIEDVDEGKSASPPPSSSPSPSSSVEAEAAAAASAIINGQTGSAAEETKRASEKETIRNAVRKEAQEALKSYQKDYASAQKTDAQRQASFEAYRAKESEEAREGGESLSGKKRPAWEVALDQEAAKNAAKKRVWMEAFKAAKAHLLAEETAPGSTPVREAAAPATGAASAPSDGPASGSSTGEERGRQHRRATHPAAASAPPSHAAGAGAAATPTPAVPEASSSPEGAKRGGGGQGVTGKSAHGAEGNDGGAKQGGSGHEGRAEGSSSGRKETAAEQAEASVEAAVNAAVTRALHDTSTQANDTAMNVVVAPLAPREKVTVAGEGGGGMDPLLISYAKKWQQHLEQMRARDKAMQEKEDSVSSSQGGKDGGEWGAAEREVKEDRREESLGLVEGALRAASSRLALARAAFLDADNRLADARSGRGREEEETSASRALDVRRSNLAAAVKARWDAEQALAKAEGHGGGGATQPQGS